MDNKLTNFPSTTEYPESDKEQFVDEKFSASDYEKSGTDIFSNEPIYSLKNELKKDSENVEQDNEVDSLLKDAFINFNNEFLKRFTKLDSSLISLNTKIGDSIKRISETDSIDVNTEDSSLGQDVLKLIDITLSKFLEYSEEDNQSLLFRIKNITKKFDEKKSLTTLDGILSIIGLISDNKEKEAEKANDLFGEGSTKMLMFLGGSFLLGGVAYSLLDDIMGKVSFDKVVDDLMEEGIEIEYNGPVKEKEKTPAKDPNLHNEGYERVIKNFRENAAGPYENEEKVYQATEESGNQGTNAPSDTSALTFTQRTGDEAHYKKLNADLRSRVEAMARDYKEITGKNLIISSTFRSEAENRRVGGAAKSRHKRGLAVDIQPSQVSEARRMGLLKRHGLEAPYGNHPEHVQPVGGGSVSKVEPDKKEEQKPVSPINTDSFTRLSDNIRPARINSSIFNFFNQGFPTTAKWVNQNFLGGIFEETQDSILRLNSAIENFDPATNTNINAVTITTTKEKTHNPDKN